ncbi:MAG TPA: hypothetical protein VGL89_03750 [Candidatus Koribacter sp.]|jgi:hypothetical protein
MRKISVLAVLATFFMLAPALFAQNDGEVGVFADYTRLSTGGGNALNFVGVGARVAFNVHPNLALEAEGAYDPNRSYAYTTSSGGVFNTFNSNLHMANAMFGPKLQFGTGAFRAFLTVKGGLITFRGGNPSFIGTVNAIPTGDTDAVLYPGGGVEAFAGPIGIRLDVGDEIYFAGSNANGTHNNLKVSLGPALRF